MRAAVFIGPSLPRGESWPEAVERLPPAALGDVYRLASRPQPPAVIGIVDGYFERRPPVRHAEILWALSRGIAVVGAASIGALRAAELAVHGMEGIGAIYDGYREGSLLGEPLEADDEVAVTHGPPELGYPPLTLALVDLRASLVAAESSGAIAASERRALLARARGLHFKDRTLARLIEILPESQRSPLLAWLAEHGRSLKREDAALLLRRVAAFGPGSAVRTAAPFVVTDSWLDFVEWAGSGEAPDADLAVALALDPPLRERVLRQALLRVLGQREAARRGRSGDALALLTDLYGPLLAKHLGAALDDLGERAAVDAAIARRRRARHALEAGASKMDLPADEVLTWHFQRLNAPRPADLETYARSLGLARAEQLVRAVIEDFAALEKRNSTDR